LQQNNDKFSLKKEVLRKRTLLSFALSLLLFYLFFSRINLGDMMRYVKNVNLFFLFLAFLSHYVSYLVRGYRWKKMIQEAGFSGRSFDLAKIIFLFQSIDCVLPAKLGDVYGAHLMKINFSLRRSFSLGSIFLWRIIDFVIAMAIVVTSAFVLFGNRIPPEIVSALKVAGLCLLAVLVLVGVFFHSHKHFPIKWKSERLSDLIDSFHQGLRLNWKLVPLLWVSTTVIWFLEAGRFFFVCKSMGVDTSLVSILFISTCSALLTAIPFTPSGLGAVELGMVGLLAFVGIQSPVAYPLIIWDRLIAHWSQLFLGILFVLFNKAIRLKGWQFEEESVPSPQKDPALL
jgi:glycosyltransferase 2 family protein